MNYSDEYVFQSATETAENEFIFERKDLVYVADTNQGSYTGGQVRFDCQEFASNNRYPDWQEGQLAVPLVLNLHSNDKFSTSASSLLINQFAVGLKNGSYQLINSLSVQLTNNEIVTTQNFKNLEINYKILTSWNANDVEKQGSSVLFYPDSAHSHRKVAQSRNGAGISNNRLVPTDGGVELFGKSDANEGRLKRMRWTSIKPDTGLEGEFASAQVFTETFKNKVAQVDGSNITVHILALIPMRLVSDFFAKIGLAKNCYYKFTFNMNTNVVSTLTYSVAGGAITNVTATTQSPFGVCPYQISPSAISTEVFANRAGNDELNETGLTFNGVNLVNNDTVTCRLDIARSGEATATPHPLQQCRIYVPMVTLTPMYEEILLKNSLKRVLYDDYLTFQGGVLQNVQPNAHLEHTLTSGATRLRKLIIFPFINQAENGNLPVINSPFTSEPATCSPFCTLSQFNVALSSMNVYQQNQVYNFENYLMEMYPQSINGGLQSGMVSGLISQDMWDRSYGMVTVNLERKMPSEDDISKSVTVKFTNNGRFAMDYVCMIIYQKEVTVDISRGALQV